MSPTGGHNIKWITAVSVWLFLMMTSALVTAKVSLLWILRLYKYEQIHPATWYVFIAALLEAPLLCHVVHIVWNTPFVYGHRRLLPNKSCVLLGILGSVSESAAIAVYASEISYVLPEPVLLLLPASVFTLHAIIQTSRRIKKQASDATVPKAEGENGEGRRSLQNWLGVLLSSYLFWTPAGVSAILYVCSAFNVGLWGSVALPFLLLVLSATWSPHLQAVVVTAKVKGEECGRRSSGLSLVYASCRLVTVPVTLSVVMFFRIEPFRCDVVGFMTHVLYDVTDSRVWLPLLLACVFGLVTVMTSGIASKVALPNPGMRLPAMAAPAASLAFATILWQDLQSEAFWELSGNDVFAWTAVGLAFLAWLATFALPGVPLVRTPGQLLRPFADNFFAFSWSPFFLEQFMMLNTHVQQEASEEERRTRKGNAGCGKPKRVYICTTMYRETTAEMRRYLSSLKRAFTSRGLQDTALEAHIFLDNCVTATSDVNAYARQLLALITQVLHVRSQSLARHATPYGCQVSCSCIGGHALYVHCKDGRKFKAKKRWSQVMYMNYILDHRAQRLPSADPSSGPVASSVTTDYSTKKWNITDGSQLSEAEFCGSKPETTGNIWFCSEQRVPSAMADSLKKILIEPENSLLAVWPSHKADQKILPLIEPRAEEIGSVGFLSQQHQHQAEQTGSDTFLSQHRQPQSQETGSVTFLLQQQLQYEETGSESAIGSDVWNEVYAASMESTTSCNCSDSGDDCDLPSSRGMAKNSTCSSRGTYDDWRSSYLATPVSSASELLASAVSPAERATDGRQPFHIASCNLLTSQTDIPDAAFCPLYSNPNASERVSMSTWRGLRANSDDVYILATDADTEFSGDSVRALLDLCDADRSLGAACGRTVPAGSCKPIVWYQKFEYAKDFWLVKSSQNVIGSVTCCPGCFSLYRGSALRDVMTTFSSPSQSAYDTLVKDHGEDRWLCTLLMQQGWKLEYADRCRNSTHCPETCGEFMRQRRRWVLSELSNMLLIFQGIVGLIKSNAAFSVMFVLSLLHMFVWVLLSPSTTLVVTCVSFHILYHVPMTYTAPAAYCVILTYFAVCVTQPRHTQRLVTQVILLLTVGVMAAVSVGFVQYVIHTLQSDLAHTGRVEFKPYFLVLVLIGVTVYAAVLHAKDAHSLVYGLVYAAIFPGMFLTLPVYSVANMVDTSWGTRELAPSKSCCQTVVDDPDDSTDKETSEFKFKTRDLPQLSSGTPAQVEEHRFWNRLKETVLGCHINCGESEKNLRRDLFRLRNRCVAVVFILNSAWYALLTSVYIFVNNDAVCYVIAVLFSFSLAVQLVGMTSYKLDEFLKAYFVKRMRDTGPVWVREKF